MSYYSKILRTITLNKFNDCNNITQNNINYQVLDWKLNLFNFFFDYFTEIVSQSSKLKVNGIRMSNKTDKILHQFLANSVYQHISNCHGAM